MTNLLVLSILLAAITSLFLAFQLWSAIKESRRLNQEIRSFLKQLRQNDT